LLHLRLQLLQSGIGDGAVEFPANDAGFIEYEDVGVIGRGETGGLLEFLFVVVDQEEMLALVFRGAALDTVRGHTADEARRVFQYGDGVKGQLGSDALGPGFGLILRRVGEAYDDDGGTAVGEFQLPVEQVLAFNGRELLGQQGQGQQEYRQPHGAHPGIT
jgi:hypothetical protein